MKLYKSKAKKSHHSNSILGRNKAKCRFKTKMRNANLSSNNIFDNQHKKNAVWFQNNPFKLYVNYSVA